MTAATYPNRVAARAAQIRPLSVLLSVLVFPFYVIGFVVGVVWLLISWAFAAVLVGMSAAKPKATDGAD